jgi:biofilm PGA synthesis lipoprotein PgaB
VLLFLLVFLQPGDKLLAQNSDNQAVVLQYHHISSTTPRSTSVTADEFRQHMEFLRDNKFTILPLPDILKALKQGTPLPDKTAAITFDDAYISVYTAAFPLLREYGWPFTVFVPSGLIGSNPRLYTNWDQLREMGKAGVTLANHSVTHPYFLVRNQGEENADWLQRLEHEIVDAEQKILQETGQSHKIHAYPYGEYNPEIQQLLVKLGYIGMAQHSGPINAASDFEALPRFPFSGVYAPVSTFAPKVLSLAFNVSIVDPQSPVIAGKKPSAVLDFNGNYRFDALHCFVNDQPMEVTVVDAAKQQYRVSSLVENGGRRFRYNCTAPGRDKRFYWFSVPWFNPALPDG